jgi:hypothetical protein
MEPDFYAMPYLPDTAVVEQVHTEQPGVALIPQAALLEQRLAHNQICALERRPDKAVFSGQSMPASVLMMHAMAQHRMMIECATNPSWALRVATPRPFLPEDMVVFNYLTRPSPVTAAMPEYHRLAYAAAMSGVQLTAPMNHFHDNENRVRRFRQDLLVAALSQYYGSNTT